MHADPLLRALEAHQSGRHADAESGYRAAIAADPARVEPQHLLGVLLHQTGRSGEAVAVLRRAREATGERAPLLATLGDAERVSGAVTEACATLRRAADLAPEDADVRHNLVLALAAAGRRQEALAEAVTLVHAHPERTDTREQLVRLFEGVVLGHAAPVVRAVLLDLLRDPGTRAQPLATTVFGLVSATAPWRALAGVAVDAEPSPADHEVLAALGADDLLLALLPRVLVTDPAVETVLRRVRFLLARTADARGAAPSWVALAGAVAAAADNGEYAWPLAAGESALAASWRARATHALQERSVEAPPERSVEVPPADTGATLVPAVLAAALYDTLAEPLAAALGAPSEAALPGGWPRALEAVLRRQWLEPLEERRLAAGLPTLATVTGSAVRSDAPDGAPSTVAAETGAAAAGAATDVTRRVRAQYEARPYPRWLDVPRPIVVSLPAFIGAVRGDGRVADGRDILVAGCGTGQQPVQLALAHPDATITAFDLSARSLAYGARRAAALGLDITFAHGDLHTLAGVDGRYAYVACVGVLHHLADPIAGWRVLRRAVAPSGIMKIGLYSRAARRAVRAARAFLDDAGIGTDDDALREARRRLLALPADHPARAVTAFADFHALSGVRDLLRHEQERDYTLGELAEALDAVDLRFLEFQLPAATVAAFRARWRDPADLRRLDAWADFEAEAPDTFAGMYQFWCAPVA